MKALAPLLLLLTGLPAAAQMDHARMDHSAARSDYPNERLGTVSFANSCAGTSQAQFNRGVALLHDFWYEEALPQFKRIAASDPLCAMAHWGVAISIFHEIWDRPDEESMKTGQAEIREAQAHPAGTERERAYIDALAGFYRSGTKDYPARIAAYAAAMGRLYDRYRGDVDAGAFYALSLMAATGPDDTTLLQNRKAMAVLKPLMAKYPDNPGVLHYVVHACDNPAMAAEGLAAANHYGEIAQSGPHAFHMPGHIYARLGLWPQDITAQLGSIAASETAETRGESGVMDELRSYDFLLYACLQSGRDGCAKSVKDKILAPLARIASMPGMGSSYMDGMVPYYSAKLPAFYALEMRDWKAAAALEPRAGAPPEVTDIVYWARAVAHGHLRQPGEARADLAALDELMVRVRQGKHAYMADGTFVKIERAEMLGWVAFATGLEAEAVRDMRVAADLQDQVGQAEVDVPAREMLGDMLMEFGNARRALAEYEIALKLSPNRLNGLYNAGRAAEIAGETSMARRYYAALLKSTGNSASST
ncbi:MAG: hypothetical protein ABSC05_35285, partial [Candidatus Solibacter sp.]